MNVKKKKERKKCAIIIGDGWVAMIKLTVRFSGKWSKGVASIVFKLCNRSRYRIGESRSPWKRVTADVPVLRKVKIVFKAKGRWMQRRRRDKTEFFFCVNHIFQIAGCFHCVAFLPRECKKKKKRKNSFTISKREKHRITRCLFYFDLL